MLLCAITDVVCVVMVSQWIDALYFDQDYVLYYRDKGLLSFIQAELLIFVNI